MDGELTPSRRSDPYKPKSRMTARVALLCRAQLSSFPRLEKRAVRLWRQARFWSLSIKWKCQAWLGGLRNTYVRNVDVDKLYWISPERITFSCLQEFRQRDFKGHIVGGDWDLREKRFDTLDVYVAIRQVCMEKKPWTATAFYRHALDELAQGRILWGCRNEADLQRRCQYIETLFASIQRDGYKSQRELFAEGRLQDPAAAEDEVAVSIGRDGDLLFSDGAHRLAIAKLLGIPRIPVKVAVRHRDWAAFRDELLSYARGADVNAAGKCYQPITHPDLADVPAEHDCEDRITLIEKNMQCRSGRLLDIGANLGYFCHHFEERGFDCWAVENDPSTVHFLRKLARSENRRFRILTESVLDSQEIRQTDFNVVLALNIFHHFLKTRGRYEKFVALLQDLRMDELFFESHLPEEPQMQGAYKNFSPDEFCAFIMQHSCLKQVEAIGTLKDGRSLFRLHRSTEGAAQ